MTPRIRQTRRHDVIGDRLIAVDTAAVATGDGGGSDVRATAPAGSSPAPAPRSGRRSSPRRRSGSGLRREIQRVGGHPATARPSSVGLGHRIGHAVDAERHRPTPGRARGRPIGHRRWAAVAERRVEVVGDPVDVGVDAIDERTVRARPGRRAPGAARRCPRRSRRHAHAPARRRPGRSPWRPDRRGRRATRPRRAIAPGRRASTVRCCGGIVSIWLSTTMVTSAWPAKRRR